MSDTAPARPRRSWWRRGVRFLGWALTFLLLVAALLLALAWPSFGDTPSGRDLARAEASPNWRDGGFQNPQPLWTDFSGAYGRLLTGPANPDAEPAEPVPVYKGALPSAAPASGLRVTWFGHASALAEIDGVRVLTDPWWSDRASPIAGLGPQRWFAPPVALDKLSSIDAVVISHDHYDHLDRATIIAMKPWKTKFIVPLGVGAHLRAWGIPRTRITELDWWQSADVGGVRIVATPARHRGGRTAWTSGEALWAGYALIGDRHRVWYSGDSGYHAGLAEIGKRLGPFDATLIDSGQYDALWPDVHFGPELTVEAHRAVRGKAMIPIHWGTVKLANHGWTEPVERVLEAARCRDVRVLAAQPGKSVEPTVDTDAVRWWPEVAWNNARKNPIVATRAGDPVARVSTPVCTSAN